MKAFYIPAALLILILLGSLWASVYVDQSVTQWNKQLHGVVSLMEEERWDEAHQQLLSVRQAWLSRSDTFHMFLQHQDLDDTDALFVGVIAACRELDRVELRIQLEQLILRFEFLSEMQKGTWANIL